MCVFLCLNESSKVSVKLKGVDIIIEVHVKLAQLLICNWYCFHFQAMMTLSFNVLS